jgi:plasmid stabilization system protein ParE
MVSHRIFRSDPANKDLERIWDHLAEDASSAIADFVIARLFEGMEQAASNPTIYRRRDELTGAPRRINIFDYGIFSEELPEGNGIFVWRVIHGRRNLNRRIRRPRLRPV